MMDKLTQVKMYVYDVVRKHWDNPDQSLMGVELGRLELAEEVWRIINEKEDKE
tara:strand:- start:166 stop:324 length:159 start_codon:yes stop_codon:yes gene_type:complete